MKYTLCIEGENGQIDITDPDVIQFIDVKIFQSDKSANDRSDQLFCDITIHGLLTDKSQKETKEIFEWSTKTDKVNVYKNVSIQVKNQDELLRDYYLKEMYCVSYEETFSEAKDGSQSIGSFKLEMKQRRGAIETINIAIE